MSKCFPRASFLALACLFSTAALAVRPPAPQITVAATDIRQLEFNWEPVTRVTRYELWFRASNVAPWVKYAENPGQRPRFRIGVSVHLLNWRQARYYVKACNGSGCSASNHVGVNGEQYAAMGYFKAPTSGARKDFGLNLALSADGKTLAVSARDDVGTVEDVEVVHVYRKTTSVSGWRRETTLVPNPAQAGRSRTIYNDPLAITGDGNLLAIGAWGEDGAGIERAGQVYLYRRSGTSWSLSQILTGPGVVEDNFGFIVKLDDAGQRLVVSHQYPQGFYEPGAVQVYHELDGQFVHEASLRPDSSSGSQGWCDGVALSGDGNTLLRSCQNYPNNYVQVLNAPAWTESARLPAGTGDGVEVSYDGTQFLVQDHMGADAWRLSAGAWVHEGTLTNTDAFPTHTNRRIALSRDGKIAALGNWQEYSTGRGPVYPPYVPIADRNLASGGAMIWERKSSGWVVRRLVKPDSLNEGWAGHVVALGNNGKILAIGAPFDQSAARGIDGNRDDHSSVLRGAVWMY